MNARGWGEGQGPRWWLGCARGLEPAVGARARSEGWGSGEGLSPRWGRDLGWGSGPGWGPESGVRTWARGEGRGKGQGPRWGPEFVVRAQVFPSAAGAGRLVTLEVTLWPGMEAACRASGRSAAANPCKLLNYKQNLYLITKRFDAALLLSWLQSARFLQGRNLTLQWRVPDGTQGTAGVLGTGWDRAVFPTLSFRVGSTCPTPLLPTTVSCLISMGRNSFSWCCLASLGGKMDLTQSLDICVLNSLAVDPLSKGFNFIP